MAKIENINEPWEGHDKSEVEEFIKLRLASGGGGGGGDDVTLLTVSVVGSTFKSYMKDSKDVRLKFTVNNSVNGSYDAGWRAQFYVIKNSGSNDGRVYAGTVNCTGGDSTTEWTSPNLASFLSNRADGNVVDSVIIEVDNGTKTASRTVRYSCVYAELSMFDSYENKNIARISRPNIQYVTNFSANDAMLHVTTESIFGGNEKNYQLDSIVSDLSAKTISFSGEQEGERKVKAYIGINNNTTQSEILETEMMVVGSSTRYATLVAVDAVKDAVQYEDYTVRFGVYAGGAETADATVRILDADGNETASATLNMRCSTEAAPDSGVTGTYTFSVPTSVFEIKIECNGYTRTVYCTAKDSSISWEIVKGAELELNAKGRTNQQSNVDVWENNGYRVQFRNVEFDSEGGITANGWKDAQCLHLNGDARAIIPIYPLYDTTRADRNNYNGGGVLATGRTFSFKYRVNNVVDISKKVIDCFDETNSLGFSVYGDSIYAFIGEELVQRFDASQRESINNRRFSADSEVEVTITIEKLYEGNTRKNPEVKMYINGEIAASANITTLDTLSMGSQIPITLGGDGASLDVFYVRIYNKALTSDEVYKNFVMSKNTQEEMIAAFQKNNFQIQSIDGGIAYCKAQSLKTKGNCSLIVTTDLREGITDTGVSNSIDPQQLHIFYFKDGNVDADRSIKYIAKAGGGLRVRVQGTSTAAMPKKNLRYDGKGEMYACKWNGNADSNLIDSYGFYLPTEENIAAGNVKVVTKISVVINSTDDIPCTLLTTKTNYNESTATRNLPNALWVNDAINALAASYPTEYPDLLTPPQRQDARVRQTINGLPALQYYYDTARQTYSFAGKVDIITDKSNQGVFGFTHDGDYSIELRSNTSEVCNFKTSDLTRAGQKLEDGITDGNDDLEYRYPDAKTQWNKQFLGVNTPMQRLWDFVYNCSPDHVGYESNNGVVTAHSNLSITGRIPYITDDNTATGNNKTYTVEPQVSKTIFYENVTDWRTQDSAEFRKLKFYAEAHRYMVVSSFVFNGLVSHTHLWTDQRAKNQFFTHFNGDTDSESGNDILRLLPYDIDTSWRGDNDSRLRYDYTRTYQDPGIYDDDKSTLWALMDACFQTEYKQMYQRLTALGFYSLAKIQQYYKDNQVEAYSPTIYNADTEYKYMDSVTENVGGVDTTSNQRFKAHGSAVEDLDWWMEGRLYFVGGQYYSINESNSAYSETAITINLSPAMSVANAKMEVSSYERNYVYVKQGTRLIGNGYMEAYRDGGSADINLGNLTTTASDYRLVILGHKQVRSLGNLAPFKITNIEATGTVNFAEMIVGSEEEGYENNTFTGFGSAVYAACEEVNAANCKAYTSGNLTNFPVAKKVNYKGCDSMNSFRLPSSVSMEELYLPKNLQGVVITGKPNFTSLSIEGVDNITEIAVSNNNGVVAAFALDTLAKIYNL